MGELRNIKNYRENELKSYVIGNILVMLLLSGSLDTLILGSIDEIVDGISAVVQILVSSSIIYIFVFLLDSFIPGPFKFKVGYFPFGKQAGYTIFTDMKDNLKDDRFTREDVMEKYHLIYEKMPADDKEKMKYENSCWYSIYQKVQNKNKVYVSNRDFLLCRDISMMTIILLAIYLVSIFVLGTFTISWKMVAILVVEYIISDIAMRGKGKRVAYNVIAEDIYYKE